MIKRLAVIILLLLLTSASQAKVQRVTSYTLKGLNPKRPEPSMKVQKTGRVWSALSNFGTYGDPNSILPSYDWPGGSGVYYLWEGRLWIGAVVGGEPFVSKADYGNYELWPSEDGDWFTEEPGSYPKFIGCKYDDWEDSRNELSRQLGLKVIQKAMSWSVEGFNDFLIYEYKITYVADSSFHHSDTLRNVYVAWNFDADCGGRVSPSCHIDDLVGYDGWVNGEWTTAYRPYSHCSGPYPYDEVTLYPDGTIDSVPDGIMDQMTVFGDEPMERTIHGDTLYLWRNLSYMYDGDHLTRAGNDEGEFGRAPGYIGGIVLYAPPCSRDSIWIDKYGDTCRVMRPKAHQWYNWCFDPIENDWRDWHIMIGEHRFNHGYKFMPHPYDFGVEVFDYRFWHTYGPYKIADGDTLEFVFAGLMGFGLNGGYGYDKGIDEGIFKRDKWYPGLRWVADQALKAYYLGSMHSDPLHPSSPSEDSHWRIPVPPVVPYLEYSGGEGVATLTWNDIAEITPDPIDGMYDFAGYKIYRSEFDIERWTLIKGFVDSVFASEHTDDFSLDIYEWIGENQTFPHSYVDSAVIYGIPYFYAVTAFDKGRQEQLTGMTVPSMESPITNYKQTEQGIPIPIFVRAPCAPDLSQVTVAPNPYIGSARWERMYEDKIKFINIPGTCRILIYTVSGELIRKIEHMDGTGDEDWNLLSEDGTSIPSGLYVYKIEAPDRVTGRSSYKIGKFVVIR